MGGEEEECKEEAKGIIEDWLNAEYQEKAEQHGSPNEYTRSERGFIPQTEDPEGPWPGVSMSGSSFLPS